MPVRHALKLCPDLVLLPPNPQLYARASRALHEVLRIYAPVIEPRGYGHAFLDLTGTGRLFGPAVDVAARVQREVRERLRLPVSVGVAANKLVSRAATTVVKPEPLLEVPGGAEAGFLAPHPLDVLPDLHPALRSRLDDYQLELIGEVAAIAESALCAVFGSAGRMLRARPAASIRARCFRPSGRPSSTSLTPSPPTPTISACCIRCCGCWASGWAAGSARAGWSRGGSGSRPPTTTYTVVAAPWRSTPPRSTPSCGTPRAAASRRPTPAARGAGGGAHAGPAGDGGSAAGSVGEAGAVTKEGAGKRPPTEVRSRRRGSETSPLPRPRPPRPRSGRHPPHSRPLGRARRGARPGLALPRRSDGRSLPSPLAFSSCLPPSLLSHLLTPSLPPNLSPNPPPPPPSPSSPPCTWSGARLAAMRRSARVLDGHCMSLRGRRSASGVPGPSPCRLFFSIAVRGPLALRLERCSRVLRALGLGSAALARATWPSPAPSPRGPSRAQLESSRPEPGPAGRVRDLSHHGTGRNPSHVSRPLRCQESRRPSPGSLRACERRQGDGEQGGKRCGMNAVHRACLLEQLAGADR